MRFQNKKIIGMLCVVAMLCIYNMVIDGENYGHYIKITSIEWVESQMEQAFIPNLAQVKLRQRTTESWLLQQVLAITPIYSKAGEGIVETATSDCITYEMIKQAEANDENVVDNSGVLIHEANVPVDETLHIEENKVNIDVGELRDIPTLISTYYTVDHTTAVDRSLFQIDTLLGVDMHINKQSEGPKVLIYHTHSQETFVDSIPGDSNTSVVGVGAYLSKLLNETYGIETMHHPGVYDLIDGKLDRSKAYEMAYDGIVPILEANPSIEVVIDLHRDGIAESSHLVTNINGKQTAQIMFFNGVSNTSSNGPISYLPNPYIQENLAFSLQMKLAAEESFPGFTRKNYLKSYRYNMHLKPKTLLVEAGAQTNTVGEMMNAMEILAALLNNVVGNE